MDKVTYRSSQPELKKYHKAEIWFIHFILLIFCLTLILTIILTLILTKILTIILALILTIILPLIFTIILPLIVCHVYMLQHCQLQTLPETRRLFITIYMTCHSNVTSSNTFLTCRSRYRFKQVPRQGNAILQQNLVKEMLTSGKI